MAAEPKPAAPKPAAAAATAPAPKAAAAPAPAPAADPAMEKFENNRERYGAAYALMAEGMQGQGVDRLVRITQYMIGAAALVVVIAAVFAA